MKESLLALINKTEDIEKLFHKYSSSPGIATISLDIIYDIQEFRIWVQEVKFELREIYDRTKDTFIWEAINELSANFNGWSDRQMFDKVKGSLFAIRKNIDKYFPTEKKNKTINSKENPMSKESKLFISHSSNDKDYVEKLVSLFEGMGLNDEQIFCSSIPGYDIPVGKNIFDYLIELFQDYDLHIIFVHSKNYYNSPISLNEMGAAWALKTNFTSILLPGFDFSEMTGVVKNTNIAIKVDRSEDEVKDKLNQLYNQIVLEFGIKRKSDILWEKQRDSFINSILDVKPIEQLVQKESLSKEANEMLQEIAQNDGSTIMKVVTLSGTSIQYGEKSIEEKDGQCEFVKWESAIEELQSKYFIKKISKKDKIYQITKAGYEYLESQQE